MKKFKRAAITAGVAALGFLSACGNITPSSVSDSGSGGEQRLNLAEADLIADITDNAKYLNPDLLYDVVRPEDSDKIGVIVTMNTDAIADIYFENSQGYETLTAYALSPVGQKEARDMLSAQRSLAAKLQSAGLISGIRNSYTTLLNGFSAETTFGQYRKISEFMGVEKVTLSEVYALPLTQSGGTSPVENVVDVYDTGIFNSSSVDFTGEHTAVAILDSGFDYHHTVFQNMPDQPLIAKTDVSAVLSSTKASEMTKDLIVSDVYINSKIPFSYDYADKDPDVTPFDSEHGTHVAGIIGGSDQNITGVAVNTQLVLLKVFSDLTSGAATDSILAALEDAVLLKVDAINMSLGSSCGFSRLEDEDYLNSVYDKIEKAGISLVVAASNDYSSAYGGANGNTNKVTNPDSATVGSPSTYGPSLSVASISGTKDKYIEADDGYVFFFNEANSLAGKPYDFFEMLDLPATGEKKIEYVTVPGVGLRVNYSSIDVKGKIALVKRGTNTFEEKAQIARDAGAVGCIIYNNIGGDILMSAGKGLKIPLISISKDDGSHLAMKNGGYLTFSRANLAGPFMSDFSSWGPNPDLTLKPEITAHGGNILSSVPGNKYDQMSGTSMASPNMCGIMVLIRQYIKEKFSTLTATEVTAMANELVMSSATIALDRVGNPYSPRKQGAGLASLYNAVNTKAYLTVDGKDRAKIELGDDPEEKGEYTLKFNLNNISADSLSYDLKDITMTESLSTSDKDYVAEKATLLNPALMLDVSGNGRADGQKVTVDPHGTLKISLTLKLSETEKKTIRKNFPNGMYVEGFVKLVSANRDQIDLSIPYLAFFGDWTKAPLFDKTFYEVEKEAHDLAIDEDDKLKADYYATTPLGTYYGNYIIPLGSYVYTMDETKYDPIPATEEHAALGFDSATINGITTVYAGLLRNAKKMTTTITESVTGKVVYEDINYNAWKAHYNGGLMPSYDLLAINMADLKLSNNTKYTFTMKGELDYKDGGIDTNLRNSFSFSFYIDLQAPIITDTQFYTKYDKTQKKDRYYLDLYVYDNHYVQSVRPFTLVDGSLVSLCDYPIPVYGDKNAVNKVTMEITDYMDLLQYSSGSDGYAGLTNGLGIMVDDYAMNSGYYYVTLPGTDGDLVFIGADGQPLTTYALTVGEETDLAALLTSDDPTFDPTDPVQSEYFGRLSWKSSDPTVVSCRNGKIEGLQPGRAVITASAIGSDGYGRQVSLTVTVSGRSSNRIRRSKDNVAFDDLQFTYFDTVKAFVSGPDRSEIGSVGDRNFFTEQPTISFYPSEQVKIGYEIKPWNLASSRYQLHWASSNPAVAAVDENGTVTALKEGNANITLRITVDGQLSNVIARAKVKVKSEFIIENRVLTAYKGVGGEVVIPDDEGILYVGPYAFALYTLDESIIVDETDWDANKTPIGNETVTGVVIPAGVEEIQKYAFYNCPNLTKVTILTNAKHETVKTIRENAFARDINLREINLENVQIVSTEAFNECSKLETVDFTNMFALGARSFAGCTALETVDLTTVRNAWPEVFADCTGLTSFRSGRFTKLSEGMFKESGLQQATIYSDRIPASAFQNCKQLTSVDIVNDLVYVGESAFAGCVRLIDLIFGGECEYIYTEAFAGASELASVTLPDSPVTIDNYAFLNCVKLKTVTFAAQTQIENIGHSTFMGCSSLSEFIVPQASVAYTVNGSLLLDRSGTKIILAAPGFNYGDYVIPATVTAVGDGAFSGITRLTSLKFAGRETAKIGAFAFAECTGLLTVTLPDRPDVILEEGAFESCIKLRSVGNINLTVAIGPYAFASSALTSVIIKDGALVAEGAFSNTKSLRMVTLGEGVKLDLGAFAASAVQTVRIDGNNLEIGPSAFGNCQNLSTIDLTKAVGTIGYEAFYNCRKLTSAYLTNVTAIGDFAFGDCVALVNVTMPRVEYIGDGAFGAVSENSASGAIFSSVSFPDTLKYIGEAAFYSCINLRSVDLSSVEYLGPFAFAYCSSLQKVTLGSGVTEIGEYTFARDAVLTEINLENVEKFGSYAFYYCLRLPTADFSAAVEFAEAAFGNCTSLTALVLPQARKIGNAAFLSASSVATIDIPQVQTIGEQAFSYLGEIAAVTLPTTLEYVAPTAFYHNEKHTNFNFIADGSVKTDGSINDHFRLDQGVLYVWIAPHKLILNSYPTGKTEKTYTVLEETIRIEIFAGADNWYLTEIILPNTLKSIGNMAFYGCKYLKTVEFRSPVAPILEGTMYDGDYDYEEGSPVYELFYKYFNLNGSYYPLFYGQFVAMVGRVDPLAIVLPANDDLEGYDDKIYSYYFDLTQIGNSGLTVKDKFTLEYLESVILIPTAGITLKDEAVVLRARTAYNALKQDLSAVGVDNSQAEAWYTALTRAEATIESLKKAEAEKNLGDLLLALDNLGTEFDLTKIETYKSILSEVAALTAEQKSYLNLTGLEAFRTGYEQYLSDLETDIVTVTAVNRLAAGQSAAVLTAVTLFSVIGLTLTAAVLVLRKRLLGGTEL